MTPLEQLIKSQEENLARLKAQAAIPVLSVQEQVAAQMQKYLPQPAPVPVAPVQAPQAPTEAAIMQALIGHIAGVFKKALAPEDFDYLVKHISEGAPGAIQFLGSETIGPLAQMISEEYRAFLRGESK